MLLILLNILTLMPTTFLCWLPRWLYIEHFSKGWKKNNEKITNDLYIATSIRFILVYMIEIHYSRKQGFWWGNADIPFLVTHKSYFEKIRSCIAMVTTLQWCYSDIYSSIYKKANAHSTLLQQEPVFHMHNFKLLNC